jgi:hypothetical protein
MKQSILELVDVLLKHKLTANQFIFLYLKYINQDERLYRYLETTRPLSQGEINDLEEKGLILNINQSANDYWADGFIVSKKFIKALFPGHSQAEEFWDIYPAFHVENQRQIPLKGILKETFLNEYAELVSSENYLHDRIMRALRFQKGQQIINLRIDKWLLMKMWERVEAEIEQIRKHIEGQN